MVTDTEGGGDRSAPLADLLDDFREAVTEAAGRALRDATSAARGGSRPAYAVDGLDVELAVGIGWTKEDKVRVLFDPPPSAVSKVRFRVSALPVSAVHAPHLEVQRVYDPDATPGRHEFIVTVRDESNAAVNFAELSVSATRSDYEGGQVSGPAHVRAGLDGTVRIVVNTIDKTVTVTGDAGDDGVATAGTATIALPAKSAASWFVTVESRTPPASERIEVRSSARSPRRGR
jgi:hypothetical protein